MTGAMLADLGVKNLADENPSLLKDFSLESIIEMNPDYIFVVPMGNDDAAAMKRSRIKRLPIPPGRRSMRFRTAVTSRSTRICSSTSRTSAGIRATRCCSTLCTRKAKAVR